MTTIRLFGYYLPHGICGFVYDGRLPPPKGEVPVDWEAREQTLFRSTAHGDDVDRPVRKSDGS